MAARGLITRHLGLDTRPPPLMQKALKLRQAQKLSKSEFSLPQEDNVRHEADSEREIGTLIELESVIEPEAVPARPESSDAGHSGVPNFFYWEYKCRNSASRT